MDKKVKIHETNKVKKLVLLHLKRGSYLTEIRETLGISKQRLNYYINALKKANLIKKIGYGAYEIIEVKQSKNSRAIGLTSNDIIKEVRGHAFKIKLMIPKLKNWDKRREYLAKKAIQYKPICYPGWQGESLVIDKFRIHLTPKGVLVYFPKGYSYYTSTAKHSRSYALADFVDKIKKLENLFNISLRINKGYKFRVFGQHYALIKNELANQYNKDDKKLYVYNEDGSPWLIIDDSLNLDELETIHPKTAVPDNKKVQDFFNGVRRTGLTPDFILQGFDNLVQDREYYAENLKTHVGAIKELAKQVKLLGKKVDQLK